MAAANARSIDPTGPWFAHHRRIMSDAYDLDIRVPVSAPVMAAGRVRPRERPAITVEQTVYHGPYDQLGAAWDAWIEANSYETAADLYEFYAVGRKRPQQSVG